MTRSVFSFGKREHGATRVRAHALALITFLGLLCVSAKGQTTSGGVHSAPDGQVFGKVITAHGKAVPGAIVTLRDAVTGQKAVATADKHGKYLFANVFEGDYALSASFKEKESATQDISLGHRERLRKDLQIKNE
jgi:hypothetical protein